MKLLRYKHQNRVGVGALAEQAVVDLTDVAGGARDLAPLIEGWCALKDVVVRHLRAAPRIRLSDVKILAPIARPGKVLAIGLNYADHIPETGSKTPEQQLWFAKATTGINGPYDPIDLPIASSRLDYEAELVAVIGRRAKHVAAAHARGCIFGFCAGNDVSVRDWQQHSSQWCVSKSFDTHAPIGPWIVTSEEIGDPHHLDVKCLVNDEIRQHSNTRHLVFNVFDQVEYLSRAMTLEPGDLIFTGTPGGVGAAMKPPAFLKAGDRTRVEIEGIGFIENTVVPQRIDSGSAN
ncbi:fumarylacetoacetate hydrolase family protein [Bradyrhizobium sp. S3.5.5]|uniref:fumarylacetoacetate hydrolase family protein n=1 Tax=unclassified Bradyrhizobium TaxID=2631580 RepID=UPI003398E6CD